LLVVYTSKSHTHQMGQCLSLRSLIVLVLRQNELLELLGQVVSILYLSSQQRVDLDLLHLIVELILDGIRKIFNLRELVENKLLNFDNNVNFLSNVLDLL